MSRKAEERKGAAQLRRTSRYRERMREAGLRPLQIWVPDTAAPSFVKALRRQVALLRGKPEERDALDMIQALGDQDS